MTEEQLLVGDYAIHGEEPYVFGDAGQSILYGDTARHQTHGDGETGVILGQSPTRDDPDMIGGPGRHAPVQAAEIRASTDIKKE